MSFSAHNTHLDDRFTYNLVGHVKHQGLPVAQLIVELNDAFESAAMTTRTGSRGEFSFAVRPGVYSIRAVPEQSKGTRFLSRTVDGVKVIGNTTVNINLSTGCVISGSVAAPSGQGEGELLEAFLSGIELVALGIEPSSYLAVTALSGTGAFSFVVPKGKYNLALRSKREDSSKKFNFLSTRTEVLTVDADEELSLHLPSLTGLGGEVKDVFGQPVVDAEVLLRPSILPASTGENAAPESILIAELALESRALTSAEGKFQFAVEPGVYDLKITPKDQSLLFGSNLQGIQIEDEPVQKSFTLQEGHRLRGQVAYDGRLLSQCLVRIISSDRKNEYFSRTDQDGQFAISVPAGGYKIFVSAHPKDAPTISIDGTDYASLATWSKSVVVGGDTHVAVRITEGTALMGRISDDAGQARPGVKVSAFCDQESLASGTTDGEGRYCLFLVPGTYSIVVHNDRGGETEVELKEEPQILDIVWHGWSQIKFVLSGEDGQPVPRCRVSYAPYGMDMESDNKESAYPHGFVVTQDDGSCNLTLPSGVYTFKFTPPQASSYAPRQIRQLSISADTTRKVSLDKKA